jgi:hypothetical protein
MFVVPRNDAPYTVFGSNGTVDVYQSKAQLIKAIGWRHLRHSIVEVAPDSVAKWVKKGQYDAVFVPDSYYSVRRVVLNVFGEVVDFAAFEAFEPRKTGPEWFSGHRWRKSRCMRYPKTYNERRMNALVYEEDGEVPARFARTGGLADDRDDSKLILQRNWKVFRRQQWRES